MGEWKCEIEYHDLMTVKYTGHPEFPHVFNLFQCECVNVCMHAYVYLYAAVRMYAWPQANVCGSVCFCMQTCLTVRLTPDTVM